MRLQIEVPASDHCDTPIDQGAVERITQLALFVLCVCVVSTRRIKPSVVPLPNNDESYIGSRWRRSFLAIKGLTHLLDWSELEF